MNDIKYSYKYISEHPAISADELFRLSTACETRSGG